MWLAWMPEYFMDCRNNNIFECVSKVFWGQTVAVRFSRRLYLSSLCDWRENECPIVICLSMTTSKLHQKMLKIDVEIAFLISLVALMSITYLGV
jgi:hypothetical protein